MREFRVGVFAGVFCLVGILLISPVLYAADEPASEGAIVTDSESSQMMTVEKATEEKAAEEPAAEEAATEEPAAEAAAAEETATEEPMAEEAATEEPAAEETATEEPMAEETATEEPAAEEGASDESMAGEAAAVGAAGATAVAAEEGTEAAPAEETATEEPMAEEAATEEPAAEEGASDESMAGEAAAVGAAGTAAAAAEEGIAEEAAVEGPVGKAELKESLEATNEAVGEVSASINALSGQQKAQGSGGDDLKGIYDKFQTDLKSFSEKNDNLSTTYEQMKGNMESSLEGWKTQLATISNEKIRKSGEKRRESSLKSFDNVVKEMVVINRDLSSLAGILGDVDSYLAFDLTPAGIGELKGSLGEATKKATTIQKNIGGVQDTLSNLPEIQKVE